MNATFENLTPDRILEAVEAGMGCELTGLTAPLPSYINRVYELQPASGERLIVKFYRPGRWQRGALQDEHDFVLDCAAQEIPVVAPLELSGGGTIGEFEGILYAVFPKKSGREMELHTDEGWRRLGSLVGRIHLAGTRREAEQRLKMHPETTTLPEIRMLLDGSFMQPRTASKLVIDFDDMVMGPAVQDFWLLLPGHANGTRHEINLILEGYEQFAEFDDRQLRLVEVLRAMRIIYFLAWCSTQADDYKFQSNFPDWGSEMFWQREIADLEHQYHAILNDERISRGPFS
jgi:Ser/Thr protein kinase RdoA (MazF antagonist)